jgi:hypothetical protein
MIIIGVPDVDALGASRVQQIFRQHLPNHDTFVCSGLVGICEVEVGCPSV